MARAREQLLHWNCQSPRRQPWRNAPIQQWSNFQTETVMSSSILKPNHRILIVDDNPAIHADFRKILCPSRQGESEVEDLKAALFDQAPKATDNTDFELV